MPCGPPLTSQRSESRSLMTRPPSVAPRGRVALATLQRGSSVNKHTASLMVTDHPAPRLTRVCAHTHTRNPGRQDVGSCQPPLHRHGDGGPEARTNFPVVIVVFVSITCMQINGTHRERAAAGRTGIKHRGERKCGYWVSSHPGRQSETRGHAHWSAKAPDGKASVSRDVLVLNVNVLKIPSNHTYPALEILR